MPTSTPPPKKKDTCPAARTGWKSLADIHDPYFNQLSPNELDSLGLENAHEIGFYKTGHIFVVSFRLKKNSIKNLLS